MCVLIFPTTCARNISHSKNRARYDKNVYLHVQYPLLLSDLMKLELSRLIFEKYSNIKFHKNLSSSSRVVPCGRTDGLVGTSKLIVVFRNFANSLKIAQLYPGQFPSCISHHASPECKEDWLTVTDWLTDRLTDWLTDRLTNWLTDWPTDWQTDRLTDRLTDWLADWLTDRLADRLTDLPSDWTCDWPTDWTTDWPTDWPTD